MKDYFAWEPPDKPISVYLHASVIHRMERDVLQAFKALPKRGAEIGGLLLGRAERGATTRVYIDDFVPVPCEYRRGPSYLLSETDCAELEQAITRSAGNLIGCYRSHTRSELRLDDEDVARMRTYFSAPENVFLVVKPISMAHCVAGFFFWEDGGIRADSSPLEFPFGGKHLPFTYAEPRPVPEVKPQAGPRAIVEIMRDSEAPLRKRWTPQVACVIGAVSVLLGFQTWDAVRSPKPAGPAASIAVAPSVPAKPRPSPMPAGSPSPTIRPKPIQPVSAPVKPIATAPPAAQPGNRAESRSRKAAVKPKPPRKKRRLSRLWPFHKSRQQ